MSFTNLHDSLDKLLNAMAEAGATPAHGFPEWSLTGQIQRFRIDGDKVGSKNGWINFFVDGQGCVFGNWKLGSQGVFFAGGDNTQVPKADWLRLQADARTAASKEQRERHREAAKQCRELWLAAQSTNPDHPYLQCKQVKAYGLRQRDDLLLVPVFNNDGQLMSLQFIGADGNKRFKSGGCMKGGRMGIGDPSASNIILICEGWATGATLHEATGYPVVVCFTAGNLAKVASDIRQTHRRHRLVICADNDHRTPNNPGLTAAMEAAIKSHADLAQPEFTAGERGTDFNDFAAKWGLSAVESMIAGAVDDYAMAELMVGAEQ